MSHFKFYSALAHVIAGRDSQHHMPGIYYGGLPKTQLSSTYLAFLEKALTPHSTHFTEDTARDGSVNLNNSYK